MDIVKIGNVGFANVDMLGAISIVSEAATSPFDGGQVVTVNSDILLQAQRDPELAAIISDAYLVTADGMPILWLSRIIGHPLKERVTGADLTTSLCANSASFGLRLFFLGAQPGVAERAREKALEKWPDAHIVGTYSPTPEELMNPESSHRIVRLINESNANVVLVAFGAPKQERWISRHITETDAPVMIGVGASLDFLAGSVPRAPEWMQKVGVEWFFRLLSEPRRLWKRYWSDLAIFRLFFLACLQRVGWRNS